MKLFIVFSITSDLYFNHRKKAKITRNFSAASGALGNDKFAACQVRRYALKS
jgi:hypothetical protein